MGLKVGIDVGGTYIDAVVVSDKNEVLANAKTNSIPDPTDGIVESLDMVLRSS
jgi:N-methylhydantoinase A/oxoprolinase/acetone carboxylase beta subunit